jgi:hypothetical protein
MSKRSPMPHMILPETQLPEGRRAVNAGVGVNQPLAAEVMREAGSDLKLKPGSIEQSPKEDKLKFKV